MEVMAAQVSVLSVVPLNCILESGLKWQVLLKYFNMTFKCEILKIKFNI